MSPASAAEQPIRPRLSDADAVLILEALEELGASAVSVDKLKATTELAARIQTARRR